MHVEGKPLLGGKAVELRRDVLTDTPASDMEDLPHAYTPFLSLTQKVEDERKGGGNATAPTSLNQLGTFNGVYVPCLLNIIGVILFLRLGWAIGQAGVLGMLLIFFFAELQAVLTVLSASAIASNGSMRGGGSYYLISRSLGPEFGGSIGLQFYLLYASGVAMYLVGFAEEVEQTWFAHTQWEKKTVVVTVASIALVSITAIALIGAHAFSKVNQYLFVVQFACIAYGAIAICTVTPHVLAGGGQLTGPRASTLTNNMHAHYTSELNVCGPGTVCDLAQVYAIVFPLATGFMEGLNLSGDLKHPGKSIPVGSLAAIVTACVIYLSLIFLFGASFTGVTLRTNFSFFQQVSASPYVVIVGILVSCYTSGLGALFGASRILQAIARDNLFPCMSGLGQGSAHGDEPQAAVVFTALLSLVFIFIGDLDVLAPICTSFFCLAYAAVNFTALILQSTGVPNFRPTFTHSCWPLSLLGVVVNLGVMIYLNALYAAVTFLAVSGLFVYLYIAGPNTSWGNVSQALIYHQVRKYLLQLDARNGHLKFWRPAVLFVPPRTSRHDGATPAMRLCNQLKKGGLYIVGDIVLGEFGPATAAAAQDRHLDLLDVVRGAKLKAIPQVLVARTTRDGYQALMQCAGLGGMDINTVALDWMLGDDASAETFVGVINDALLLRKNVVLFRDCHRIDPALILDASSRPTTSLFSRLVTRVHPPATQPPFPKTAAPIDVWITDLSPWTSHPSQHRSVHGGVDSVHHTLLLQLTHVLHSNPKWKALPIRLLRVCEDHEVDAERQHVVDMAADLRLKVHHVLMVPLARPSTFEPHGAAAATQMRHLNGLMQDQSRHATLVVVALPDPTAHAPPTEFVERVDTLTRGCPPTMLVWSAHDESVITTCI
ncbi:Aste57867_23984 [Aphanomyces stellatus]|uniref:Aste57867_23984 protein n=1 Tax=Aphanomyces stellatus TaxID=120398 RepID=A0A485LP97_9STRA|nr:hypothetical protein As57867_023911 [Aphanomyces stellatus]VFU00627.1 Aste57867_23984 [Aphanomyces stellatus]